jgi:hypothetical protein
LNFASGLNFASDRFNQDMQDRQDLASLFHRRSAATVKNHEPHRLGNGRRTACSTMRFSYLRRPPVYSGIPLGIGRRRSSADRQKNPSDFIDQSLTGKGRNLNFIERTTGS